MAKEKNSSDMPEPKPAAKKAAKKSPAKPAKKVAAKKVSAKKVAAKKPAAIELAAAAASSQLSTPAAQSTGHPAQPQAAQLHDEIRRRAYELFRQRGGQHGSHEADWHRAESEVRSKYKA